MRTQCGDDSKQGDYHATGNEQPLHRNLRLARNAEWLAPPDYNQRLQADVICLTYHGLVFSDVSRFRSGPAMCRRSSTIRPAAAARLRRALTALPVLLDRRARHRAV